MKTFYVYVLQCADSSLYTSITRDLSKRLEEHEQGKRLFTRERRPVQLGFYTEFENLSAAVNCELEIKSWPQERKEALLEGNKKLAPLPKQKIPRRKRVRKNQLSFQL